MSTEAQRVLVLEDDPLMQRFVSYALEDEHVLVTYCSAVPEAMQRLAQQSFDWILTDLMLPGESGLSFIEKISRLPEQLGKAKIVALSAGIDLSMQHTLLGLGVFRQLLKPISVRTLQELFRSEASTEETRDAAALTKQEACARYFAGQTLVFEKFSQQSRQQFAQDILDAEYWLAENNYAALRNAAHSLKSVFLLLGEIEAHTQAQALETLACAASDPTHIQHAWEALRKRLHALAMQPAD